MSLRVRPGVSLAELLVAFALGGVVAAALGGVLRAQEHMVRRQTQEAASATAQRVTAGVLAAELRALRPAADVRGLGSDSVGLRVFRGAGSACAAADGGAVVRYRGLRLPEPTKDSVLAIGALGEVVLELGRSGDAAADACAAFPGERLLHWSLDPAPARGTLLLVFETGSYHLADRAFRYRRGRSGRQPLTEELLDTRVSEIRGLSYTGGAADAPSQLAAVVTLLRSATAVPAAGPPLRLRVPLRNSTPP